MSIETTVTGRIAEPELRYTQQGKAVLDLRICATRRALNKNTNEWADDGEPLWVSAPFWERDAEYLAEILGKGSEITVTGTLAMETYETPNGRGSKLVVRFPRFKGLVPKRQNPSQAPQDRFSGPQSQNPGTWTSGTNMAPQNGVQDPAGNLATVQQQFNPETLPPF